MRIVEQNNFSNVFPMEIVCKRFVDEYGFSYGKENDFCGSKIEIEASDIVGHDWEKYPNYSGTDYGVICPVCGQFIEIDRNVIPKSVLKAVQKIRLNNR